MEDRVGKNIPTAGETIPQQRETDGQPKDRSGGTAMSEEEKVLEGRADANIPAILTKDVPGG